MTDYWVLLQCWVARYIKEVKKKIGIAVFDILFFYFFIYPLITNASFVFFAVFGLPSALIFFMYSLSNNDRWWEKPSFRKTISKARTTSVVIILMSSLLIGKFLQHEELVQLWYDPPYWAFSFLYTFTLTALGILYILIILGDIISIFDIHTKQKIHNKWG